VTKTRAQILAMPREEFEQSLRELQADQIRAQTVKGEEDALKELQAKRTQHLLLHSDIRELAAQLVKDGLTPETAARVAAASIAARGARR
jgi:hypothetical protein